MDTVPESFRCKEPLNCITRSDLGNTNHIYCSHFSGHFMVTLCTCSSTPEGSVVKDRCGETRCCCGRKRRGVARNRPGECWYLELDYIYLGSAEAEYVAKYSKVQNF